MTESGAKLRRDLLECYQAGLSAVHGRPSVASYLRANPVPGSIYLVAIGKAASAMAKGALEECGDRVAKGLIVTKYDHLDVRLANDSRFSCIEAGHPVPDGKSLVAGEQLLSFLRSAPQEACLLFLISGGASSLVEVLARNVTLEDLARANSWLLASGLPIMQMNRVRKALSCIKGGGLKRYLDGKQAQVLLISDVPDDDLATIGSGMLATQPENGIQLPGALPQWLVDLLKGGEGGCGPESTNSVTVPHHIVASNRDALQAISGKASSLGYTVQISDEFLQGPVQHAADRVVDSLAQGNAGCYLWGAETTVQLPKTPGRGGRSQSLALAVAMRIQGVDNLYMLAAGTDGTDGPGQDAGALVDGGTVDRGRLEGLDAGACLEQADAGNFLSASGDLISTGPTGTNVMDVIVGLKV